MEDIQGIKDNVELIMNDEVGQVMNRFVSTGSMPYADIIRMERRIELNDSVFSSKEIAWLHYNHLFWLSLIKARTGRKIFLHLYRYNDNVYRMKQVFKTSRTIIYKWIKRFLNRNLIRINTQVVGNEVMYCLNRQEYPTLTFLTKWFISEMITKESMQGG